MLDVLHLHHTHEDVHLWPYLLERSPGSAADLDALEAEHEVLTPLIEAAHDAAVPLPERAVMLDELHRVLNAHLDHEERVGVPLMLEHLTPEVIRADARKAETEIGRNRMPVVFGWLASCLDDEQLAVAVQQQPRLVRIMFRHGPGGRRTSAGCGSSTPAWTSTGCPHVRGPGDEHPDPGAGVADALTDIATSLACEYATLTHDGRPVTWPVTPYQGERTLDVSTGLTYPLKAERARRNPQVALSFSDPAGYASSSGSTSRPPVVLVEGLATVRDADLQANTDRYVRESIPKVGTSGTPWFLARTWAWYYARSG